MRSALVSLFGAVLVIINLIRAFRIPITHDETGYHPEDTYLNIMRMDGANASANNHILHSVIRKFLVETIGYHPIVVRIDSVIAHVFFIWLSYRLCKLLFGRPIFLIAAFLALNLQPFMFEFWGLGRGYALALTFMLASVYLALLYFQNKRIGLLYLSLLFGMLSVYANFTLLNFYCGLAGVFAIRQLFFSGNPVTSFMKRDLPALLLCSAVLYLMIATPLNALRSANQLYYGGDKDVFHDTTMTLVDMDLYGIDPLVISVTAYAIFIAANLSGLYWLIQLAGKKDRAQTVTGLLLWLLLVIPVVSTIVQHSLLGTKYLVERTGMFLIPLYILQFSYWMYAMRNLAATILTYFVLALCIFNFSWNMNVSSTRIWWYDSFDLVVVKKINAEEERSGRKVSVGAWWFFYPSLECYRQMKFDKCINTLVNVSTPPGAGDTLFDYYYLPADQLQNISPRYVPDTIFLGGVFRLLKKQ